MSSTNNAVQGDAPLRKGTGVEQHPYRRQQSSPWYMWPALGRQGAPSHPVQWKNGIRPGRMVKRDSLFKQSSGRFHIEHFTDDPKTWRTLLGLFRIDWFHVLLTQNTITIVMLLVGIYTAAICLFAAVYLMAENLGGASCGLTLNDGGLDFQAAFAFSLETATTVGYTLPGNGKTFFENCSGLTFLIYLEMIAFLLLNAMVVGITLLRVSRADNRAHLTLFSDKACVRCVNGRFYFSFQLYDLDQRNPLVEAHVRCYAVLHHKGGKESSSETFAFWSEPRVLRLLQPDDELGALLLLSTPARVVHEVDQWSPLMPDSFKTYYPEQSVLGSAMNHYASPGLIMRQVDCPTGNRSMVDCPVCGETFGTEIQFENHLNFMVSEEDGDGEDDQPGKHGELQRKILEEMPILQEKPILVGKYQENVSGYNNIHSIEHHLRSKAVEIIVLCESIDPRTSNTVQARHSYTIDDIAFDHEFDSCMTMCPETGVHKIILDRFHNVIPVQPETA